MTNTVESVWRFVDKRGNDECWPWNGYVNYQGRGRIDIGNVKGVYVCRAIYLSLHPNSITLKDDGTRNKCVCHTCDNPNCCNPAHLFLGNHQENMDDKVRKGRAPDFRGHRAPRSKLTEEDVFWMRIQKRYGATKKALAMLYDVSEATVSGACYGRHYQDILR